MQTPEQQQIDMLKQLLHDTRAALASSESQRAQAEAERDEWKARYEMQAEAFRFDKSFNRAGAEAVEVALRVKLSALSEALRVFVSDFRSGNGPEMVSAENVADEIEALLKSSTGS